MTYQQSLAVLTRPPFDRKTLRNYYGKVERMHRFFESVGNPQDKINFTIVGGTVGKGSTCYYITRLLKHSTRVGFSISPHLQTPRERIQINEQLISKRDFSQLVRSHLAIAKDINLSYPEFLLGLAVVYFVMRRVNWAVIEVGLGGRYDPANTLRPAVTVITNIGRDHGYKLGYDPLQRLKEKYGITRPHVPLVTGINQPRLLGWLKNQTAKDSIDFRVVNCHGPDFRKNNLALAQATVELIAKKYNVLLSRGSAKVDLNLPGRFERINERLLLDGAHNPDGFKALKSLLKHEWLENSQIIKAPVGNNPLAIDQFIARVETALKKSDRLICATGSVFAVGRLRDQFLSVD